MLHVFYIGASRVQFCCPFLATSTPALVCHVQHPTFLNCFFVYKKQKFMAFAQISLIRHYFFRFVFSWLCNSHTHSCWLLSDLLRACVTVHLAIVNSSYFVKNNFYLCSSQRTHYINVCVLRRLNLKISIFPVTFTTLSSILLLFSPQCRSVAIIW